MTHEQILLAYVSKLRQSDNGPKHVLADTIVNIVIPGLKADQALSRVQRRG